MKCVLCQKRHKLEWLAASVDAALEEGAKHEHASGAQVGTIVAKVQINTLLQRVERGVCVRCAVGEMFEASACPQVRDAMRAALPAGPVVSPAVSQ